MCLSFDLCENWSVSYQSDETECEWSWIGGVKMVVCGENVTKCFLTSLVFDNILNLRGDYECFWELYGSGIVKTVKLFKTHETPKFILKLKKASFENDVESI